MGPRISRPVLEINNIAQNNLWTGSVATPLMTGPLVCAFRSTAFLRWRQSVGLRLSNKTRFRCPPPHSPPQKGSLIGLAAFARPISRSSYKTYTVVLRMSPSWTTARLQQKNHFRFHLTQLLLLFYNLHSTTSNLFCFQQSTPPVPDEVSILKLLQLATACTASASRQTG